MRWAWIAVVACGACGAHAPPPLTASPVASLANVRADEVVTQGDVTYALGAQLAIARGDTVTTIVPVDCGAPCPATVWTSAAAIPALDGEGHWIVATRFDGTLWRVRLDGELEAIGARFGLREPVRAVAGAGSTVAVLLEHAVLVTSDGHHVARYELDAPRTTLAVARDRIALGDASSIDVWDLATNRRRAFAIEHARIGFVDAEGTSALVAMTPRGVWLEGDGELRELDAGPVASVAIAGARLWLEIGKRLFIARDATLLDTTIVSAGGEPLFGAPNGDVWIGAAPLRRYALGATGGDPVWRAEIQPIFTRVCAHCHLPGGDAGIDLSTAAAWTAERAELVQRVITTRTMPPAGATLADVDRATIARFLGATP